MVAVGRFASTVDFYRYREPYPPAFFQQVAQRLSLTPESRLLDVGCGPGNLVIGFAPFVGLATAIDVEPEMLAAARENAVAAKVDVRFLQTPIENLDVPPNSFDLITIGRAAHWLDQAKTLGVFDRILAPGGHIAVCGSSGRNDPANAWLPEYNRVRKAWSSDPDELRYKMDHEEWFAPSRFRKVEDKLHDIEVQHNHSVSIGDLVNRALSFSNTSPEVVGDRRPQFEAELESALAPFAQDGQLCERVTAKATIFA